MQLLSFQKKYSASRILYTREVWLFVVILAIGLSVFQDFLFSRIHSTGFYISESLLYNSIWLFLIPLMYVQFRVFKRIRMQNKVLFTGLRLVSSLVFTLSHLALFASLFRTYQYVAFFASASV